MKKSETLTVEQALIIMSYSSESHTKEFDRMHLDQRAKVDAIFQKQKIIHDCRFCGTEHQLGNCPAYHTTCKVCNRNGHWKLKCKTKMKVHSSQDDSDRRYYEHNNDRKRSTSRVHRLSNSAQSRNNNHDNHKKNVHGVDINTDDEQRCSFDAVYISSITSSDEILTTVCIIIPCTQQQANLKCKVDTGVQGNFLPLRTFKKMCSSLTDAQGIPKSSSEIQAKPYVKLTVYNGTVINQYGVIKLRLKRTGVNDQQWTSAEYFIAETPGLIIIGLRTSQAMKFITVHCDAHDIKTGNDNKI